MHLTPWPPYSFPAHTPLVPRLHQYYDYYDPRYDLQFIDPTNVSFSLIYWYLLFPPYPAYSLVNNYNEFIPLYPFISLALLSRHYIFPGKTTTLVKSKLPSILCLPLCSCLWLKKTIRSMITGLTLNPLSGITSWINNLHLYPCHRVCFFKEPEPEEGI